MTIHQPIGDQPRPDVHPPEFIRCCAGSRSKTSRKFNDLRRSAWQILETLHPRRRRETPDEYINRLAKLPTPEDEAVEARSFIEGLGAGVACDIDQLFPASALNKHKSRRACRASR
jgi:hypothetical protein